VPNPGKIPDLHQLKNVDYIVKSLNGFLSRERVLELAEAGYMPCWKVDGGEPLFTVGQVKDYIKSNLTIGNNPRPFPIVLPVPTAKDPFLPPDSIKGIQGLQRLPQALYPPCVYFLIKKGVIQYVGQSVCIAARISQHQNIKEFDEVYYLPVPQSDLNVTERAFIKLIKPPLNRECFLDSPLLANEIASLDQSGIELTRLAA
jgi:hypothetical protein